MRGTVERVEGPIYEVKTRDGAELKLTVAEKAQIAGIVKASLSSPLVLLVGTPQSDQGSIA